MFDFIFRPKRESRRPQLDDVIRQVAKRSAAAVMGRPSHVTATMGDAELRGYVRARALRPVRLEAQQIGELYGWPAAVDDPLVVRSLEQAVHLIVQELRHRPVVATSAARATLRVAG